MAAVQKEVQEQAAENAMCLNDCESMELCDIGEIGSIKAAGVAGVH